MKVTFECSWYKLKKQITLLNTQCQVQPSRRQCKDIAGTSSWIPIFRYFFHLPASSSLVTLFQCSLRSYCSQDRKYLPHSSSGVLLHMYNRNACWAFSRWCHPNARAASLLCYCACVAWKETQVSNLDQTAATNPTSEHDNGVVSRHSLTCHASCVSLRMLAV